MPRYTQLGVWRLGAARLGSHSAHAFLSISGVQVAVGYSGAGRTLLDSLTVTDELNETPNTMQWTAMGAKPTVGQAVILQLGSMNNGRRFFAGHVLTVEQFYVGKPANIEYHVSAVDYTWLLGLKKVTAFYAEQSATPIAQSLISAYAAVNGFTTTNVAAGLPTVPGGITFTDEDLPNALTRLAARIGAYWYVDYNKDLHVFLTDAGQNPTDLTASHPSLADVVHAIDLSQHVNRVYVEGRGSTLLGAVLVGDTLIPLVSVDMFEASGEFAKISFQGSDGGAQHLTFTGVVRGGAGTVVGPGLTPAAAPSGTRAAGAGVTAGTHQIAYGWRTAAGPTLPGPLLTLATGFVDPPASGASAGLGTGSLDHNAYYAMAYTFTTAAGETTASSRQWLQTDANGGIQWSSIDTGPSGTTGRKLYRTDGQASQAAAMAAQLKLLTTLADNSTTIYNDGVADGSLGANVPTSNTATAAQFDLSAIAVGPAGTTSRDVYMTTAGGAQLKLVTNIADNTTTTLTVTTADGSLGANAPSTDTSGLTQPDGQVNPGGTSLTVASTAAFESGGGWALIGNGDQVIRYTGFSAGALTGIPASGVGAITAAVAYNSTVTATPMLTGIPASGAGSIQTALTAGDEVYLVVRRDDAAAQATLASRLGGDGIREEWIQDRRLSIPEATARGDAILASRPLDAASLTYTCRDLNTVSGKDITVNLVAPTSVSGTFKIQRVVIANFRPYPTQYPTFTVDASAQKYSFEDLLRQRKAS